MISFSRGRNPANSRARSKGDRSHAPLAPPAVVRRYGHISGGTHCGFCGHGGPSGAGFSGDGAFGIVGAGGGGGCGARCGITSRVRGRWRVALAQNEANLPLREPVVSSAARPEGAGLPPAEATEVPLEAPKELSVCTYKKGAGAKR